MKKTYLLTQEIEVEYENEEGLRHFEYHVRFDNRPKIDICSAKGYRAKSGKVIRLVEKR